MARKRKSLKHLDYYSSEYWNRLLAQEGLSMQQGDNPKLIHVGGTLELEDIQEATEIKQQGRKLPKSNPSE